MASEKILSQKQVVIDEIKERAQNAKTIVLFDYRGITDADSKELHFFTDSNELQTFILEAAGNH